MILAFRKNESSYLPSPRRIASQDDEKRLRAFVTVRCRNAPHLRNICSAGVRGSKRVEMPLAEIVRFGTPLLIYPLLKALNTAPKP